jgi:RNA polymerase sigma factor (sigma-70 family)
MAADVNSTGNEADLRIADKIRNHIFDAEVEAFIRRFARAAMAQARRFGHKPADCEDFVQDFWLVLLRNGLRTYSGSHPLTNYCFRIFMNEFYRRGGAVAAEARIMDPIDPAPDSDEPGVTLTSPAPSAEDMLLLEEWRSTAEDQLNGLEPDERQLLVEHILNDMTAAEMAGPRGIKEGTMRVRIHRALKKLRDAAARTNLARA